MLTDVIGRPLRFIVMAGQVGGITWASALIPSNRTGKVIIPHDAHAYKQRNCIERCFCWLKHFRRFATWYDKRKEHFTGFINLAAAMIWMR